MKGAAEISACGCYRYLLRRELDGARVRPAVFVMLNPSTADASHDDATIRRCIAFARRWEARQLIVANLYGLRATDPRDLRRVRDPIGPENDATLAALMLRHRTIICAWGARAAPERVAVFRELAERAGVELRCLGVTKLGHPRHPLYVRGDTVPRRWVGGATP